MLPGALPALFELSATACFPRTFCGEWCTLNGASTGAQARAGSRESMRIEHASLTARFFCDRSLSPQSAHADSCFSYACSASMGSVLQSDHTFARVRFDPLYPAQTGRCLAPPAGTTDHLAATCWSLAAPYLSVPIAAGGFHGTTAQAAPQEDTWRLGVPDPLAAWPVPPPPLPSPSTTDRQPGDWSVPYGVA